MKQALIKTSSPGIKLLTLFISIISGMLIVNILGVIIAIPFFDFNVIEKISTGQDFSDPSLLNFYKYMQVISHFSMFIVPSILFAFLINHKVWSYLSFNNKFTWKGLIVAIAAIIISLPVINFLGEWNAGLSLPENMSGLETWMKNAENTATETTMAFLNVSSFGAYFFNLFMIALIPAIGEELLFRGLLIKLFRESFKNKHIAIIISALIFSAFHMQFYGFIPRFGLGLFLGYLFVWSGSIWLPIIVHFINNAAAVTIAYLHNIKVTNVDIESFGNYNGNYLIIISSFIFTIAMLWIVYKFEQKKTSV